MLSPEFTAYPTGGEHILPEKKLTILIGELTGVCRNLVGDGRILAKRLTEPNSPCVISITDLGGAIGAKVQYRENEAVELSIAGDEIDESLVVGIRLRHKGRSKFLDKETNDYFCCMAGIKMILSSDRPVDSVFREFIEALEAVLRQIECVFKAELINMKVNHGHPSMGSLAAKSTLELAS